MYEIEMPLTPATNCSNFLRKLFNLQSILVVSDSTDFEVRSQESSPFYRSAFDCSLAKLGGFHDHFMELP